MIAPVGAVVGITCDQHPGATIAAGEYLRATTGRLYLIVAARPVRGKHPRRLRLQCLVQDETPPGAVVHPLTWNRRK